MELGYLSVLDLSEEELDTYIKYLESSKGLECLPFLDKVLGKEIILFLDLFAGEVIKVPTRSELIKIANYVIIYNYIKQRNFTDDAYTKAASLFKRRVSNLKRIVEKVENITNNIK